MSTTLSTEPEGRSESVQKHVASQSAQWRDIGITAVAAAAQYSGARDEKSASQEKKVVTLRDIDFLAA